MRKRRIFKAEVTPATLKNVSIRVLLVPSLLSISAVPYFVIEKAE